MNQVLLSVASLRADEHSLGELVASVRNLYHISDTKRLMGNLAGS